MLISVYLIWSTRSSKMLDTRNPCSHIDQTKPTQFVGPWFCESDPGVALQWIWYQEWSVHSDTETDWQYGGVRGHKRDGHKGNHKIEVSANNRPNILILFI